MSAPVVLHLPAGGTRERVDRDRSTVVVGGGIAGVAAATVMAERGFRVTLLEREGFLGGRAGAWTDRMSSGESFEMERGFHAFFRQYYNLNALLRRIDPQLTLLLPLKDYPILGPHAQMQSFSNLPRRTPFNVLALTARTRALRWRDLLRVDKRRALEMLTFDVERTYARWDHDDAGSYLDSLRFPADARRLLFDVFAHSFFNPERKMSAAELLMMFHFYFTGNPQGLVFDVARRPFSHAIWGPFERYLRERAVDVRLRETATQLTRRAEGGWRVLTDHGAHAADGVVLATTVPGLHRLVEGSPDLDDPSWRAEVASLQLTHPFAVWRMWLDGPTQPGRAPFVGTTGVGILDNISLVHLFEDESREWAARSGGSVVELHAYAVDPTATEADLRSQMRVAAHHLYPEIALHAVLEERFFVRHDCPAFAPGSHATRPTVSTPFKDVTLAGDFVKLPLPSALMERAAASGFLAANYLMAREGVRPEPLLAVSRRGLLARWPMGAKRGASRR